MGFLAGVLAVGKKVVSGAKTLINNAKTGKAAIQAGFTIKGGADTDAAKAATSVFKTIPVYVWGIAVAVLVGLAALVFGRRR